MYIHKSINTHTKYTHYTDNLTAPIPIGTLMFNLCMFCCWRKGASSLLNLSGCAPSLKYVSEIQKQSTFQFDRVIKHSYLNFFWPCERKMNYKTPNKQFTNRVSHHPFYTEHITKQHHHKIQLTMRRRHGGPFQFVSQMKMNEQLKAYLNNMQRRHVERKWEGQKWPFLILC